MLNPTSGQTPDAYAGDVHDPMSQKPFMWNNNNPIAYSDPSGYDASGVLAAGGAAEGACALLPGCGIAEGIGLGVTVIVLQIKQNEDNEDPSAHPEPQAGPAPGTQAQGANGGTSVNQANQKILRGQAPKGVERVDAGDTNTGEQDHVHVNGGAINRDGSIKHNLNKPLTKAQRAFIKSLGFSVPR